MHKHCACKTLHRGIPWLVFRWLPMFLQQKRLCASIWTEHSSVHTTFSHPVADVASSTYFWAKSKRFALLASHISWKYTLPLNVHPSDVRQWRTVRLLILYPWEISSWWSWIAIVSSSNCICASTISLISVVIFDGLPRPGCQVIDPVSKNCLRNLVYASPTSWETFLLQKCGDGRHFPTLVGAFQPW